MCPHSEEEPGNPQVFGRTAADRYDHHSTVNTEPSARCESWNSQESRPVIFLNCLPGNIFFFFFLMVKSEGCQLRATKTTSGWTGHSEGLILLTFVLLEEKRKPVSFFPFHSCFALLALLHQAGRIAVCSYTTRVVDLESTLLKMLFLLFCFFVCFLAQNGGTFGQF